MKFLIFLSLLLPSLAFSYPIKGTLTVTDKPLRIKKGNGKTEDFNRGEYRAIVDMLGQKKRAKIEIFKGNSRTRAYVRIPSGFKFPANGGFVLSGAETGQGVDIYGNVRTKTKRSEDRYGYERCTYTEDVYVCDYDRYGRRYCYWRTVSRSGEQEVEYYIRKIDRTLSVQYYGEGGPEFRGRRIENRRVYTYKGRCF